MISRLATKNACLLALLVFACAESDDNSPVPGDGDGDGDHGLGGGDSCDPDTCADGSECRPGSAKCHEVDNCGFTIGCDDSSMVCDPFWDRCFPANGDCSGTQPCPEFGSDLQDVATISCERSRCKVAPRTPPPPAWLAEEVDLTVVSPAPAGTTTYDDEIVFSWIDSGEAVLLRVLDAFPTSLSDYEARVVWGASVARGATPTLAWSDGASYEDGKWSEPEPPEPGDYYFSLLAVGFGQEKHASPLIPFVVGGGGSLLVEGESCSGSGLASECARPDLVMACHESVCRRVCASHRDCPGAANCGATTDGFRMCGVNVD